MESLNPLAPGRYCCNFISVISDRTLQFKFMNLLLVEVNDAMWRHTFRLMAWCRQATGHEIIEAFVNALASLAFDVKHWIKEIMTIIPYQGIKVYSLWKISLFYPISSNFSGAIPVVAWPISSLLSNRVNRSNFINRSRHQNKTSI